jgi:CHAT domain
MSRGTPATTPLALAEEAYGLVQVDPRRAQEVAQQAQAAAVAAGDHAAQVAALHALTWSQFVLGDPRWATTGRLGIRIGERAGELERAALLRRHFAQNLAAAGKIRAAVQELDLAVECLTGLERVRSQVARVVIQRRAHASDPSRHRRVVADARVAARRLRAAGDRLWEARLAYNLGVLELDRSEIDAAESDLRRAFTLYTALGAQTAATEALLVLAVVSLRRGDVVEGLATIDSVELRDPQGSTLNNLLSCRLTACLQARLMAEAAAAADDLVRLSETAGWRDFLAQNRLSQANVAILSGDFAAGKMLAAAAGRAFSARGKRVNAALARRTALEAGLLGGEVTRRSLRACMAIAETLDGAGWRTEALRTHLLAGRAALELGAVGPAREQIALADRIRGRGSATDRVELAHARGLLALAEGDARAAERRLVAGLNYLEAYRGALGAAELRAAASEIGVGLARSGLRMALASGRASRVLSWAERLRANALRVPQVRPARDLVLRTLEAELRALSAQVAAAERSGRLERGAIVRQAAVEGRIRARARLLKGRDVGRSGIDLAHAGALLGEQGLVEYVALDGRLAAVTSLRGRLALHDLGADGAGEELEWLRFALIGLARGVRRGAERKVALEAVAESASALDRLLVQPLLPSVGGAPLVIVPTGRLHALPWAALPSLAGRPIQIAPSLATWIELTRRPRSRRLRIALVAGPRLRQAAAEIRALAAIYPGAIALHGRHASAEATLAALDGAKLAHLACHGRFRADSPLFSSLELADGPLNVYELQTLRRAPETVVLSACDLAVSGLQPGDELLGLAAALLSLGTRTIVASVVPVPDAAAKRLMVAFHRRLVDGESAAAALARAQQEARVSGFVCLGSG